MIQELQPHTVITNYEASRDGVVRHRRLKKPFLANNGHGYLIFGAAGRFHLNHRIVYEYHNGLIKDGFVINYNSLSNLQAFTQSENTKRGGTGKYSKNEKPVKSKDIHTGDETIFQLINEC